MALTATEQKELRALAKAINERNERERVERERLISERIDAAHHEVERLVDEFKRSDPDLRSVVLFGSLARGDVKRLNFDIDLAVRTERFMDLLGIAIDSTFKVDLIDLSTASPYIAESVERDGTVVFDGE